MTTVNGNGNYSTHLSSPTPAAVAFTLSSAVDAVVVPASGTEVTIDDAVFLQIASATTKYGAIVSIEDWPTPAQITFTSTRPSIGTVDATGRVSYVATGTTKIVARTPVGSKGVNCRLYQTSGTAQTLFDRYLASAARAASDAVDTRLVGHSGLAADYNIFSTRDDNTATYVRNTGCWAYDIDMTAISVWNSALANKQNPTAISRRHCYMVRHYYASVGTTLRFVTTTNDVVTRTVTAVAVGDSTLDIAVVALDSDLPASITPVKTFADAGWATKFPSIQASSQTTIPLMRTSQFKRAELIEHYERKQISSGAWQNTFIAPATSPRSQYFFTGQSGDSGSPVFYILGGQLVLLSSIEGFDVAKHAATVQALMDATAPGYSLTTVDLSSYPSY